MILHGDLDSSHVGKYLFIFVELGYRRRYVIDGFTKERPALIVGS
jgi:hypothetical protein